MTELRRRMIEDLQLKGMSERTQEMYVRAVRQLAEHYRKAPDRLSEEDLRRYFLFLKNVKHYSRTASTIALCGIKFFYEQTLKCPWPTLTFVRAAREKKLPVVLSLAEVRCVLHTIRLPRYRVCLTTIYACGLRLQEGTHLQVPDVDQDRTVPDRIPSLLRLEPRDARARADQEAVQASIAIGSVTHVGSP